MPDAVVIGSGPNGLAAAITLARTGRSVQVYEANQTIGGGCRSAELTLPGFVHDTCSTVQALGLASPFMQTIPWEDLGVSFVHPEYPLAHPLGGERAAVLQRSVKQTAAGLGRDRAAYRRLIGPVVRRLDPLLEEILGPLRVPRHPWALGWFGVRGLWPAATLARTMFRENEARALFGGVAAHSIMPLGQAITSSFGLVLTTVAHGYGWPVVEGGAQKMSDALASYLSSLGGEVVTGVRITDLRQLPEARAVLFDVTPRQLVAIAKDDLPPGYRKRLEGFRYGPGVFKLDLALSEPIPWSAPECRKAGTVHVCGTLDEIVASEAAVASGEAPKHPFVLVVQPTIFDSSRAPEGKHIAWMYCHLPSGSEVDMTHRILDQVERFAPGFRDTIIARNVMTPTDVEQGNANYIGGDINGGIQDIRQLYTRPVARLSPYTTPNPRLFICSSSTPPGGGVHGMSGYHAAKAALKRALN